MFDTKQALARAIYAQKSVIVLDDILNALDIATANTLVERLFSPQGLLRTGRTTVILGSHSGKYF